MRILVAEDDEVVRTLLLSFLKEEGHEVRGAADGMELIKMAMENKPEVIFTDLHMPNMNGDTMISMIEMYSSLSDVPIVVVTGATEKEIRDMAISKDIPILPKPLDFEKISIELEKIKNKPGR